MTLLGAGLLLEAALAPAGTPAAFDAARAFGARPSVVGLSLSPDGTQVAYIAPARSNGASLVTGRFESDFKGKAVLFSDGKPFRLSRCRWVSDQRLVCQVFGIVPRGRAAGLLPVSRWLAINADGSNVQTLGTHRGTYSRGYFLHDGDIVDYLPDEDAAVLMSRVYTPDNISSEKAGLSVERVDTRTMAAKSIIFPHPDAFEYLSDGRGTVRVMGVVEREGRYPGTKLRYYYRMTGATDWKPLSEYDQRDRSGFTPVAVDRDLNVAYGFRQADGRFSLYTIRLDGSLQEQLVYSRPDVDLGGLLTIGRRQRVVGVTYVTERAQSEVFDPEIQQLLTSLSRALPQQPLLRIADSSADESKLLIFAGSDTDPGVYYLFDRKARQLATFLVVRADLEGVRLATVKPVTYPAADGVMIPGYLTLPPGQEDAHGLRAIVLPHGGPSARDQWGFNWLTQYFANRGYAVLQPEFRGSAGYGDEWLQQNGFRSWRVAINDVLSAGRWLVAQGIADPARIGILGWSYGGYAALQSAVVDPTLFKAVVAIAPVTDLPALVEAQRYWGDFELTKEFVGDDEHEASPIEHAGSFKAPVLLFHGTLDRNVGFEQSERMEAKLKSAGVPVELVTFKNLDHQLEDSVSRADMLRRSDAFLQAAFQGGRAAR